MHTLLDQVLCSVLHAICYVPAKQMYGKTPFVIHRFPRVGCMEDTVQRGKGNHDDACLLLKCTAFPPKSRETLFLLACNEKSLNVNFQVKNTIL